MIVIIIPFISKEFIDNNIKFYNPKLTQLYFIRKKENDNYY